MEVKWIFQTKNEPEGRKNAKLKRHFVGDTTKKASGYFSGGVTLVGIEALSTGLSERRVHFV